MRILLIEPDSISGATTFLALGAASFDVDWRRTGVEAQAALKTGNFAAVVLERDLADIEGIDLLRRLRASGSHTPVVLTSTRDSIPDRVSCLDAGADDYLPKPYATIELVARVKAVLRRPAVVVGEVLSTGNLRLDLSTRDVTIEGRSQTLTPREFDLLRILMERPGAVCSKAHLETEIYGVGVGDRNAIEFLIHALRKKIGSAWIQNVRGHGWRVPRQP